MPRDFYWYSVAHANDKKTFLFARPHRENIFEVLWKFGEMWTIVITLISKVRCGIIKEFGYDVNVRERIEIETPNISKNVRTRNT